MNRVWRDDIETPRAGDGVRSVREAVGDVLATATAFHAEVDAAARQDAAQRVRRVLTQHRWVSTSGLCRCSGWQQPDPVADPRTQHDRHVAERLAAAGLLDP